MLLLTAVSLGMIVAVGCRVLDLVLDDPGCVEWPPERAEAAVATTARYVGAPYEFARRLGADAVTTRELEQRAVQALIEDRERRLQAMTHEAESRRFRRAG